MNPYSPPNSAPDEPPAGGRALAVVVGAAVGNGLSYAALSLCGVVFLWVLSLQGVPTQELYTRVYQSNSHVAFAHVLAFLCLLPGGYWSARLSKDRPFLSALLAGIVLVFLTVVAFLVPYAQPIPLWSRVASLGTPIPAFLLGAHLWQRAAGHFLPAKA